MAMMPKRVKFRKSQRGKIKGNATQGNHVAFGEYGLQSLEPGWIPAKVIEAGACGMQPLSARQWPRVHTHLPDQVGFIQAAGSSYGVRARANRNSGRRW